MATKVRVSLNHAALERTTGRASEKILRQTSREVVALAKLNAPVGKTAKLANSVKATTIKRGPKRDIIRVTASARGTNGKDYAKFVTEGTGRYGPLRRDIVAARHTRNGGPFRFEATSGARFRSRGANATRQVRRRSSGQFVYAAKTRGQRPQNFLHDALAVVAAADPRLRMLK